MRSTGRAFLLCALALALATIGASAPAAFGAFGVEERNFEAGTCKTQACTYKSVEANHAEAFTQAAGHPQWGITGFELNSKETTLLKEHEPEGALKRVRVDVPPGLAADPQALPVCSDEAFNTNTCPSNTEAGSTEMVVFDGVNDLNITGSVYNLQPRANLPLLFGIDIKVPPLVNVHILLEGHVAWWSDYHEYFEINNIPREGELSGAKVPLSALKSKLFFNGRAGNGNFLTLPSICSTSETAHLEVESWDGEVSTTETHTPIGVEGCNEVPFKPSVVLTPETAQSDTPDGAVAEVKVPQFAGAEEINTADIEDAHVTLPEGLTLNPAAAPGLETCTEAQIAIGKTTPVSCPAASRIGSVTIETDLPAGSLAGPVYLGSPSGAVITGPPYTIYIDAESVYGVSVRLQGHVSANPTTGRLEASFLHNPELPFSDLIMKLNGGPRAPLANPLACGPAPLESLFTPYTGVPPAYSPQPFSFVTSGCTSPLPFALAQSTQASTSAAAAHTSYTLNLARSDGQQYLSQVRTVLPEGLVGAIPSVTLCGEPSAAEGACPAASRIGTATVTVGAGSEPIAFSGPVFMTGPYNGAPFGLSVPVPAKVGRFDLGSGACDCVVTRATVGVDPYTSRVIATSSLPTIVKGVPLRLRSLSVSVDRSGFLSNPTNCAPLATNTTLTSTFGSTQSISTPFQASGCGALPFKPRFVVSSVGRTSRANGAGLQVSVSTSPGEANIASVFTQLPRQIVSRLSTLNQACPEATFSANAAQCPAGSRVGEALAVTPVLPGKLTGPAMFVSHGNAAFPDLDIVLQGDGVTVVLVGNTNISGGITTSDFASVPDVPVSSFQLSLPEGRYSALSANGSICSPVVVVRKRIRAFRRVHGRRVPVFRRAHGRRVRVFKLVKRRRRVPLLMPTTITGQNGKVDRQTTHIAVTGCPRAHRHPHHRRRHHRHTRRHRRS
jgi:hypothetical protein